VSNFSELPSDWVSMSSVSVPKTLPYLVISPAISSYSNKTFNTQTKSTPSLSNNHYHIHFNTIWLISWTLKVKAKLLSKQNITMLIKLMEATILPRSALKGLNASVT
jgi:hypothetical protein